jgi:CheY-like chemotaxis protein
MPTVAPPRRSSRPHRHAEPARPSPPPPSGLRDGPLSILLVEDDADTREIAGDVLRQLGYEVVAASSVAGALGVAKERPFDILISDIGLPDGNGFDLMRALRASGARAKGIALTGFGTGADVTKARQAGFAMHLTKPISLTKLQAAIKELTG